MVRAIWAEEQLRVRISRVFLRRTSRGLAFYVYTTGNLLKKAGLTVDETMREVRRESVLPGGVQRDGIRTRHNKYASGLIPVDAAAVQEDVRGRDGDGANAGDVRC